jgi:hypothetical protein
VQQKGTTTQHGHLAAAAPAAGGASIEQRPLCGRAQARCGTQWQHLSTMFGRNLANYSYGARGSAHCSAHCGWW